MYSRAAKDLGMKYEETYNARSRSGGRPRFDEGFTTDTGRFVGRSEAGAIAQRMGQATEIRAKGLDAGDLKPIESPIPQGIGSFSPYELGVDPERFQFKAGGDEAGVTDRLKDIKTWDPIKAGVSLVWIDKANKPWIVDGHQRLGLARRIAGEDPSQNPRIDARILRENEGVTPADARTIAALKNIAGHWHRDRRRQGHSRPSGAHCRSAAAVRAGAPGARPSQPVRRCFWPSCQ